MTNSAHLQIRSRFGLRRALALGSLGAVLASPAIASADPVAIGVNGSVTHQTWYGFGATHETLVYGGKGDVLSPSQRTRAVDALFHQVKITTGQAPTVFEAPASSTLETFFGAARNDNADPMNLDPQGFFTGLGDAFKKNVVDVAGGPADLYPDVRISIRYASKWLDGIRTSDYNAFLDECAEQALAGVQYWKKTYGATPRYAMLFNEPTSGNTEVTGASATTIADIVKRTGQRLVAAGLDTKLVVPGEETEEKSLATATAILADAETGKYVGAIAYHTYPYGSTYSYVPNILGSSAAGMPSPSRIAVRGQLRDLAAAHGVPLFMSEVSHAYMQADGVEATDFRILRGRATHIHDEMVYADAAAFFGMNSMWDSVSQSAHFGTDGSEMTIAEHDTIILVKQSTDEVIITSTGRAIGHYARFIGRGARRVDASSPDPLVLVSAFVDPGQGDRLVLVVVNNAPDARDLAVSVDGAALGAKLSGEQSTATAVWQKLAAIAPDGASKFSLTVPGESVTTIATAASSPGSGSGGSDGSGGGKVASGGGEPASGTGGASRPGSGGGDADSGDAGGCSCRISSPHDTPWSGAAIAVAFAAAIFRRRRAGGETA